MIELSFQCLGFVCYKTISHYCFSTGKINRLISYYYSFDVSLDCELKCKTPTQLAYFWIDTDHRGVFDMIYY